MFDNTTWAFVGLVLFFAVLGYYGVFGMVTRMLDKRAEEVTAELDAAQQLRREAEALLAEYQQKRIVAEQDAAEIIAHAEAEAKRMTADAEVALKELIEQRTRTVEAKIAHAEAAAVAEVRAVAIDMAIAASKHLLAEKVQGKVAADLISNGVDEVKARFG
ncbi:ATP F0F1 synthase subunit B [Pleomorphomonas sp. NRK KF1]|uniref:F0F1 ATP synthase subunit B family protein n=1 Tax=Pleomorphomonas sp. NRK KF1 TaxID=2943000 RepID=UPI002042CF0D|nr:ATP F0F1 synthase subunit B [Pleomorphomonas sp. NRK KF1]MCM5552650.1 ATP F0F1 synthase subunit B [Pleomorphomonas sp. NRK KF1]